MNGFDKLYQKYCCNKTQTLKDLINIMMTNHMDLSCDVLFNHDGEAVTVNCQVYTMYDQYTDIGKLVLHSSKHIDIMINRRGKPRLPSRIYEIGVDRWDNITPELIEALIQGYASIMTDYTHRINKLYDDNADLLLHGSLCKEDGAITYKCPRHKHCGDTAVKSVKLAAACIDVITSIANTMFSDDKTHDIALDDITLSFNRPLPIIVVLRQGRVSLHSSLISHITTYHPGMLSSDSINALYGLVSVTRFIMSKNGAIKELSEV